MFSNLPRFGSPSAGMSEGYIRLFVLNGSTLHWAPVSTLAFSLAGISGRSFSSILSVAYTSSRLSAHTFTLSKAVVSKLSVSWPVAWLI